MSERKRCTSCDRFFAQASDSWPDERLCFVYPGAEQREWTVEVAAGVTEWTPTRDCEAHAVDWRQRALDAESRLRVVEEGTAGMRERLLDLDRFLREWHQRDHAQVYDSKTHREKIQAVLSGTAGQAICDYLLPDGSRIGDWIVIALRALSPPTEPPEVTKP